MLQFIDELAGIENKISIDRYKQLLMKYNINTFLKILQQQLFILNKDHILRQTLILRLLQKLNCNIYSYKRV